MLSSISMKFRSAFVALVAAPALAANPAFAAPAYVTQADIDAVDAQLRAKPTYCPALREGSSSPPAEISEAQAWVNALGLRNEPVRSAFSRYQVAFKGRSVSLVLPHRADWALQGKQVRPYLITGPSTIAVGELGFIDHSVQDEVCAFERKYTVTVEKGSIKTAEAAFKKELAAGKAGGLETDESADLGVVMLGASSAFVPTVRGNYHDPGLARLGLVYDRVITNLSGGWMLTVKARGGLRVAKIDSDMVRIAVSAR
jgi:hypothetical protein